jgi:hypothetical protein
LVPFRGLYHRSCEPKFGDTQAKHLKPHHLLTFVPAVVRAAFSFELRRLYQITAHIDDNGMQRAAERNRKKENDGERELPVVKRCERLG